MRRGSEAAQTARSRAPNGSLTPTTTEPGRCPGSVGYQREEGFRRRGGSRCGSGTAQPSCSRTRRRRRPRRRSVRPRPCGCPSRPGGRNGSGRSGSSCSVASSGRTASGTGRSTGSGRHRLAAPQRPGTGIGVVSYASTTRSTTPCVARTGTGRPSVSALRCLIHGRVVSANGPSAPARSGFR